MAWLSKYDARTDTVEYNPEEMMKLSPRERWFIYWHEYCHKLIREHNVQPRDLAYERALKAGWDDVKKFIANLES